MMDNLNTLKNKGLTLLTIFYFASTNYVHAQKTVNNSTLSSLVNVQADTLAITNVKIVDGTGKPARTDQNMIIINGKIAKVGNSSSVKIPKKVKIINGQGKTLIPGMIMMHEHLFYGKAVSPYYLALQMPVSFPQLYLAGGVTTMRTAGSVEPQTDLTLKKWINTGKIAGPNIDVTGPYIEREGLMVPEILAIESPLTAEKMVNYWADMGCTSFKVYMNITKEDLAATIAAAHKRNIKVTGHLCSVTYREAAELGIDNLEHGFFASTDFIADKKENKCPGNANASLTRLPVDSKEMKELMQFLINKKVTITSTLPVFEPYTDREVIPGGGEVALAASVLENIKKNYDLVAGKDVAYAELFKKQMAWEKQFVAMGGRLTAGSDPTGAGRVIPGYANRHSLELLTEAGFSFPEAVKITSLNAAEYLGIDKKTGTIEAGKDADLVLINGDPEKNIKEVLNTEIVFKKGVGYDSKKLFEQAAGKVGLH
ncbi:amidohydrolase family protein [Chryseobacterium sp. Marseille-Q3244]|uniref:amidohydrolase family protein n=1 Tax=Chryseobacterium sp. Marseille-Q3244 TaxID=2758092 RepID=UPI0020253114|nr:amidohydrolase family protein [Chryseobacterium sp. Marseille-Q3244]